MLRISTSLVALILCGCTWGQIPITAEVGGYGFEAHATIVIPQKPPKVIPVVSVPSVKSPTLIVPIGEKISNTAVASSRSSNVSVPVVEAPVKESILAVPK